MAKRKLPARIARFIIGEAGELKLRLMVELNRRITTSQDLDEILNYIADTLLDVISYDAAGIFLLNPESHALECVVARGYSESDKAAASLTSRDGIVGWVITTGESVLAAEVADNPYYINWRGLTRSQLTVPILSDGRIIGAFSLESDKPGNFSEKDLEWLSILATQVAIALDKARLHQELLKKKQLDEELRIAHEVQLSLLPKSAPKLAGLDIAGINVPSRNVGGDYFDFITIIPGHLGIVVADVSGKGVPASLIMASFRAFLRAEIRNNYAIRTIFTRVNNLLHEILQPHQFVTALYGVLDLKQLRFTYSNAGHHPAILLRANGKRHYLTIGGMVLGIFEDTSY